MILSDGVTLLFIDDFLFLLPGLRPRLRLSWEDLDGGWDFILLLLLLCLEVIFLLPLGLPGFRFLGTCVVAAAAAAWFASCT